MESKPSSTYPATSSLKAMANASQLLAVQQSVINKTSDDQYYSRELNYSQLIQYPPDIISTTVERKGWISSSTNVNETRVPNRSKRNRRKHSLDQNDASSSNGFSITEIDKESLKSYNSDILSDISEVNGFESLILNQELGTRNFGTQLSAQCESRGVQANMVEEANALFTLQRENATLRGKLESMDYVMEEMVKERSGLQQKLHSYQKEIRSKDAKFGDLLESKQKLVNQNEDVKGDIKKWEKVVGDYLNVIEINSEQERNLKREIAHVQEENKKYMMQIEEMKIDMNKTEEELGLSRSMNSELTLEMSSLTHRQVYLNEELNRFREENKILSDQNDLRQSETEKVQAKLNEMRRSLATQRNELITAHTTNERIHLENVTIKQKLFESTQKLFKEKEELVKNLGAIESQLLDEQTASRVQTSSANVDVEHKQNRSSGLGSRQGECELLQKQLAESKKSYEILLSEKNQVLDKLRSLERKLAKTELNLTTVVSEKNDIEAKLKPLLVDLQGQRDLCDILRKEKISRETQLLETKRENKNLKDLLTTTKENCDRIEMAQKRMKSDIVAREIKFDLLEKEKITLEGNLAATQYEIKQLTAALDKPTRMDDMAYAQIDKLEKALRISNSETRSLQSKYEKEHAKLQHDYESLKYQLNERSNLLENFEKENKELKLEISILKQPSDEVTAKYKELVNYNNINDENAGGDHVEQFKRKDEKIRCLESNLKLIIRKYKEATRLRDDVQNTNIPVIISTSVVGIQTDSEPLENVGNTDTVNRHSDAELLGRLLNYESLLKEKENLLQESQALVLRLETDKGKQINIEESSLKQRISLLENMLESKAKEFTDLEDRLKDIEENLKEEVSKLQQQIYSQEEELRKEKLVVKDLRHTIFLEKRDNCQYKRDINSLRKGLSEINHIADKRKQELTNLQILLTKQKEVELITVAERDSLLKNVESAREEFEKLKQELLSVNSKEEPLLDQIKNLLGTLKEKNNAIEGLQGQLNATVQRYEAELKSLKTQTSEHSGDVNYLKNELNEIRREKFGIQARLCEMKVALKNSLQKNKQLQDQLASYETQPQDITLNEEYVNKLLTYDCSGSDARPLFNLQACLEALKDEMNSLQDQISHANQ